MTRDVQTFALSGGLNLSEAQIKLKPGELVDARNVEVSITGGYRRVDGYERFDGQTITPSNNTYTVLSFVLGGPREFSEGETIVGQTSGSKAEICGPASVTSGTFPTDDAEGTVGITLATGDFEVGEQFYINGVYAGTVSVAAEVATLDDANRDEWIRGAANRARERILVVPGSGPVRGVRTYNGITYAFRDNAGATAGAMWKATATGWEKVDLTAFKLLSFDTGLVLIGEGKPINGLTSGATATVRRVAFRSGTWGTNATGVLAITDIVGAFQAGETIRLGVTNAATATAVPDSVTLPAGGRYEFDQWNFYASKNTTRLYFVNGVGTGFEFDNNDTPGVLVPIATGMTNDVPEHVAVHKNYLYFTFKGSIQNGGAGEPHAWTARLGASELGIGEQITAIHSIRQDVLGITSTNSIHLLYGGSAVDWSLKKLSREVGCFVGCFTEIPGSTAVYDTNGVQTLAATLDFGDLKPTTLSFKIDRALRSATGSPIGMLVNRDLSQLRLYFDDGKAFYATFFGSKIAGWCPLVMEHDFFCLTTGEDADGEEVQFAGGADGYVYKLNTGNSFDGKEIESLLRFPFHHYGTPERKKRFRKIVLEMDSPSRLDLQYATEYNYGDQQYATTEPVFNPNSGGLWDSGIWGQFAYDGGFLTAPIAYIAGVGKNMSVLIRQSSDIAQPWSVQAATIHYSPWGVQR